MSSATHEARGGLTSPILSGRQASIWQFVDQVFVKYGPLGVMLVFTVYYVLVKDKVIAQKDILLLDQQRAMVDLVRSQTEAMAKATLASQEVARSVDENTRTMQRLVIALEKR